MKRRILWGNVIWWATKNIILIALVSWFLFSWGEVVYHQTHYEYEYSATNLLAIIFRMEV